jgi:hypothetical protein
LSFVSELEDFLAFTTGAVGVTAVVSIDIKFDSTEGEIFASACTKTLHLPNHVPFYDQYKEAMQTAIMDDSPSFNSP